MTPITRALVSVSDKTGIVEFCQALAARNIEILSTGGTAQLLAEHQVPVIEVSDYTGFPEMMGGRIKTLHPKVHGGILGRRGEDEAVMTEQGIDAIDLVVVNLYPFQATIAQPDCSLSDAIENIDIGGPTMIRAAAKNHASVTVVVDPDDYNDLLQALEANQGQVPAQTRFQLALKSFEHTAAYDAAISAYLAQQVDRDRMPAQLALQFEQIQTLRYGENPHQQAAFYRQPGAQAGNIATARSIQGKALSYNNIADADAALECVKSFSDKPTCVIVKHANPCGVAQAGSQLEAYNRAYQTDPASAFGGIIAFNQVLEAETAKAILERQFVEVIITPDISSKAQAVLAAKPNIRVLSCGQWPQTVANEWDFKRVNGGLLVQDRDLGVMTRDQLKVVSKRQPDERELNDLLFTWKVAKFVKSNAIVYGKDEQTIGVGAGQMSRVYSARVAALKAADEHLLVAGSVMASDAFFPFRDGIDSAAEVGITAVIQPGGSMRDEEVIAAANEHQIAMVFTGMRHFRH